MAQTYSCSVPTSIQFQNLSSNGSAFIWDFGDGTTDTSSTPLHIYDSAGIYTISLIASGSAACGNNDTTIKVDYITIEDKGAPGLPNCTPTTSNSTFNNMGITSFKFGTIDHTTPDTSNRYLDFSCIGGTNVKEGSSNTITVITSTGYNEDVKAWIDYNNDGVFTVTEEIFTSDNLRTNHNGHVIIPSGVVIGTPLRLRVMSDYYSFSHVDACEVLTYGHYEDYSITIDSNTNAPIANFGASNLVMALGDSTQLIDSSLNAPTTWQWTVFNSDTSIVYNGKNPSFDLPFLGSFSTELICSNAFGSDTLTKLDYIKVLAGINMCSVDTIRTLEGVLFDDGGTGDYDFNKNCSLLIDPGCATSLDFTMLDLQTASSSDYIRVYNGENTSGTLLINASGTNLPATVTATSGKLFITWVTNSSANGKGFKATWKSTIPSGTSTVADFAIDNINPPLNYAVQFTDQSTYAPVIWDWDFNGEGTSSDQNPSRSFATSGSKQIRMIADNCYGLDTITKTLMVQDSAGVVYSIDSIYRQVTICNDSVEVDLNISSSGIGDLFIHSVGSSSNTSNGSILFTELFRGNPDFVEFMNVGKTAVDLTGWTMVLGNSNNISTYHTPIKGMTGTLAPGQISNYDDYTYGTGIGWGSTSSCWAMLLNANGDIEDLVFIGFTEAQIAAFSTTIGARTYTSTDYWSGAGISLGSSSYSAQRVGNSKNNMNTDFVWNTLSKNSLNTNLTVPFNGIVLQADWLSLSTDSLILSSGNDSTIKVILNSKDLVQGKYTSELIFVSNDAAKDTTFIPVVFDVDGKPSIEASRSCIAFDTIMATQQTTESLWIKNTGCDTLNATNLSTQSSNFSVDTVSFVLLPGDSIQLNLVFTADSLNTFLDTLSIVNNDLLLKICLSGVATGAPSIVVLPDTVRLTSTNCNDTIQTTLKIVNNGEVNLDFDIENGEVGSTIEILAFTLGADMYGEYANTRTALSQGLIDYNLTELSTTDSNALRTALEGKQILLLPEVTSNYATYFGYMKNTIQNFVDNGGTAIVCAPGNTSNTEATGLIDFNIYSYANGQTLTEQMVHPLVEGMPSSYVGPSYTYGATFVTPGFTSILKTPSNYEVLAYKKVNKGIVIYLGFDFYQLSSVSTQLLTNAVNYGFSNAGTSWINVLDTLGTVAVGDTQIVDFEVFTDELITGTYEGKIQVNSNDPLKSNASIPVIIELIGSPEISLSKSCSNFDTVMQYRSKVDTVYVYNTGCDTLTISSWTNTDSVFTYDTSIVTSIAPNDSLLVSLIFTPKLAGVFRDTFSVSTNAGLMKLCMNGVAFGAPTITLNPDSFNVTINACNDSITVPLWIGNIGESNLDWEFDKTMLGGSGSTNSGATKVLSWTYKTDFGEEYTHAKNAVLENYTNVVFTESATNSASVLNSHLLNNDVLLIPELQNATASDNYAQFASTIQSFLTKGGTVIACGMSSSHKNYFIELGLFTGSNSASAHSGTITNVAPEHPLMEGVSSSFSALNATLSWAFTDNMIPLASLNGLTAIAYKEVGKGQLIYIGYDYYDSSPEAAKIIANSVKYAGTNSIPDWLTLSDSSGTTQRQDSTKVDFTFNATGLVTGTYTAMVQLVSNDPLKEELEIPVVFNVNGEAEMLFSETCITMDTTMQYRNSTDSLWIFNPGCDTLRVDGVQSSSGEFTVDMDTFQIAPFDSMLCYTRFTPDSIGLSEDSLFFNTNIGFQKLCINGVSFGAPEINLVTDSIIVTIPACDANQTEKLIFGNIGLSELSYAIKNIGIAYDSLSTKLFTLTGENTIHTFSETPSSADTLQFIIGVSGDFESSNEYADIYADGILLGRHNGGAVYTSEYIDTFYATGTNLATILADGAIIITVDNSPYVSATGGRSHKVRTLINGFTWLSASPTNGTVDTSSYDSIALTFNSGKLSEGTYSGNIQIQTNDPKALNTFVYVELNVEGNVCPNFNVTKSNCSAIAQFENTSINNPTYIRWDFGDGEVQFSDTVMHNFKTVGSYDVELVACNEHGCDSIVQTVVISQTGGPFETICKPTTTSTCCGFGIRNVNLNTINYTSSDASEGYQDLSCSQSTTLNLGRTYNLSVTTSTGYNENVSAWLDKNGNGIFESDEQIFESINQRTNHSIDLIFTDVSLLYTPLRLRIGGGRYNYAVLDGCSDLIYGQYEDYTVVFEPDTIAPVAGMDIQILNTCDGTVQFNDTSFNATNWFWSFGDGDTSNSKNPAHEYIEGGKYEIQFIASNPYGTDTLMDSIMIHKLTPSITCLDTAYVDEMVQFSNDILGSTEVLWNFGDDYLSTKAVADHAYEVAGNYQIELTITKNGCTEKVEKTIVVLDNGVNPVARFGYELVCGRHVDFIDSSINSTSWLWSFGDGDTSIEKHPTHQFDSSGLYTVQLIVTNANGADTISKAINFSFTDYVSDFTVSGDLKVNGISQFAVVGSYTNATWKVNGIVVGSGSPFDYTWLTALTNTVQLISENKLCQDSITKSVLISEDTLFVSASFDLDVNACSGELRVVNTSENADSIFWDFGNGFTGDTDVKTINFASGTYSIQLKAFNSFGVDSVTQTVEITLPSNEMFVSGVQRVGSTISFELADTSTSTLWNFGDGILSNVSPVSHVYDSAGSYAVSVIYHQNGCVDTLDTTLLILEELILPTANFDYATIGCSHEVVFTNTSLNETTWSWLFGDHSNDSISSLENPTHYFDSSGTYSVRLIVSNGSGIDTIVQSITLNFTDYSVDFVQSGNLKVGEQISFDVLGNSAISRWSVNGVSIGNGYPKVYDLSHVGSIDVELISSYEGCLDTVSHSYDITEDTLFVSASFDLDVNACSGELRVVNTSENADSIFWDFGNGFTGDTDVKTINFASGTYSIQLKAFNSFGVDSVTQTVEITLPSNEMFVSGVQRVGSTISFELADTSTSTLWNFGDGILSNVSPVSHVYDSIGSYSILVLYTQDGCMDTLDTVLTIEAILSLPEAAFEHETIACTKEVNFENLSLKADTWSWNFGDGNSSSDQNPAHVYAEIGEYEVVLIATNANGNDTIKQIVSISEYIADFEVIGEFTIGESVRFNILGDSDVSEWYNDGVLIDRGSSIDYILTQLGTMDIQLVSSFNGCSDTVIKSVIVGQDSSLPIAAFETVSFDRCSGLVELKSTSLFADSLVWSYDDASVVIGEEFSHSFSTAGTYNIRLVAFNQFGVSSVIESFIIEIPTNHIIVQGTPLVDSNLIFDLAESSTSILWSFDDGLLQNGSPTTHNYSDKGVYNVIAEYTSNGCIATVDTMIIIDEKIIMPLANFEYEIDDCSGDVSFTNLSEDEMVWEWSFGDGETSDQEDPIHRFDSSGIYTVKLIVSNAFGVDSMIQLINVDLIIANFEIEVEGLLEIEESLDFNLSIDPAGVIWNFGNGDASFAKTPSYMYAIPGTYEVFAYVTERGCKDTASRVLIVNDIAMPVAQFDLELDSCNGIVTLVNTTELYDSERVDWNLGDETNSTEDSLTHQYIDGTYSVSLIVWNKSKSDTMVQVVTIDNFSPTISDYEIYELNEFISFKINDEANVIATWDFGTGDLANGNPISYAYDRTGEFTVLVSVSRGECLATLRDTLLIDIIDGIGLNDLYEEVNVYPNPAVDQVNITFGAGQYEMIRLFNALGALVQVYTVEAFQTSLLMNVDAFNSGEYHIQLIGEKERLTKRLNILR